jgi:hypothetical protein
VIAKDTRAYLHRRLLGFDIANSFYININYIFKVEPYTQTNAQVIRNLVNGVGVL